MFHKTDQQGTANSSRAPAMGTVRAGAGKSQSRKEQFRWKIGTTPGVAAVGLATKEVRARRGSVKSASVAGATVCHSWLDVRRVGIGVSGARSPAGRAQQDGMEHLPASGLQQ